jgi:hypothetical protein
MEVLKISCLEVVEVERMAWEVGLGHKNFHGKVDAKDGEDSYHAVIYDHDSHSHTESWYD